MSALRKQHFTRKIFNSGVVIFPFVLVFQRPLTFDWVLRRLCTWCGMQSMTRCSDISR